MKSRSLLLRLNKENAKSVFLYPMALCFMLLSGSVAWAAEKLEQDFLNPPAEARPQTFWHWINGNVTQEGITADLEAMARIGIGGAAIFNVAQHDETGQCNEPPGPVKFLSPEWRALTQHAIQEAARVGIELTLANCSGWSESGGPWVTPEQSMQMVVWSETNVPGPVSFSAPLRQPEKVRGFYRDIAVYAFPTLPGEEFNFAQLQPIVSASVSNLNPRALLDGDATTEVELPAPAGQPQFVQLEFREPVTFGKLHLLARCNVAHPVGVNGRIEVSDDGKAFRKVDDLLLVIGRENSVTTASFASTAARFVRLLFTDADPRVKKVAVVSVQFGAPGIPGIAQKAGCDSRDTRAKLRFSEGRLPPELCVAPERMIGAAALPENQHLTWSIFQPYQPHGPLMESGLIGPVRLLPVARVALTEVK